MSFLATKFKTIKLKWLPLPFVMLTLAGCGDDKKDNGPKPSQEKSIEILQLDSNQGSVLDRNGAPIANAQIMIGDGPDLPFKGNFLQTDQNGNFSIPPDWKEPLTITIDAPGFIRASFLKQEPRDLVFNLKALPTQPIYELSGQTKGHNIQNGDNFIDFGVIIPAMTKKELLNFDLKSMFSTRMDSFSIAGMVDAKVPGNVTLPTQSENYFMVPVKIDKPAYHLQFPTVGTKKLFTLSGRVPFKQLASGVQNKTPFQDLINLFQFNGGAMTEVNIDANGTSMDLPSNSISFEKKKHIHAPGLSGEEIMFAMSVSEMNSYLIPTDVKQLTANSTMAMASIPNKASHALSILKRKSELKSNNGLDRFSAALNYDFADNTTPEFLPLIENPRMVSADSVGLPAIETRGSIRALANVITLSSVRNIPSENNGGKNRKDIRVVWEIYSPGWISKLQLPNMPTPPYSIHGETSKRWDIAFLGTTLKQTMNQPIVSTNEHSVYENTTHITHSSLEF